jgi:hypothetical protein
MKLLLIETKSEKFLLVKFPDTAGGEAGPAHDEADFALRNLRTGRHVDLSAEEGRSFFFDGPVRDDPTQPLGANRTRNAMR